jgi:hypothetical protein
MHRGRRCEGWKVNEPGKKVDEPEKGDYEVLGPPERRMGVMLGIGLLAGFRYC